MLFPLTIKFHICLWNNYC